MHLFYFRAPIRWATVVVACALAPLCLYRQPAPVAARRSNSRGEQAAHRVDVGPLRTVHVGQHPVLVAIDARDRHIFVANEGPLAANRALPSGMGSVSMVDERTGAVLRTVTVGQTPVAIAFDAPTGRVFVLTAGRIDTSAGFTSVGGSVSVLDAVTGALVRTLEVGPVPITVSGSGAVPSARQALAVDATSGRVYVAAGDTILALDGSTGLIRQTLDLSTGGPPQIPSPSTVVVSAQAQRLYVGDGYDAALPPPATPLGSSGGSLAVLNNATNRGVANVVLRQQGVRAIAVDERANRVLVFELPGDRTYPTVVEVLDARTGTLLHTTQLQQRRADGDCAIGVDRRTAQVFMLYTPSGYGNDATVGTVDILDARSGRLLRTIALPTTSYQGYFLSRVVAVDDNDRRVVAAVSVGAFAGTIAAIYSSDVYVLDTRSGKILHSLKVGAGPQDVAIDEVARRVFITNEHDNTLSVFDALRL